MQQSNKIAMRRETTDNAAVTLNLILRKYDADYHQNLMATSLIIIIIIINRHFKMLN